MKKSWLAILISFSISSFATTTVTVPISLLFKFAKPMITGSTCNDGLIFHTPAVNNDMNASMRFTTSMGVGNGCGGSTVGATFAPGDIMCLDEQYADKTYCIENNGLSALATYLVIGVSYNTVACFEFHNLNQNTYASLSVVCSNANTCTEVIPRHSPGSPLVWGPEAAC